MRFRSEGYSVNEGPLEERYISPDGALTFLIVREFDEISLGFQGCPSHTHGDILAELSGLPLAQAVNQYVEALISNKSVVAIATVDGRVRDIWIADEPGKADPYKPENEIISYRYWNGTPFGG
jgi:hypothetical protein